MKKRRRAKPVSAQRARLSRISKQKEAATRMRTLARYMPNTRSLGYALFLAVNATAVWGGVFPFLPMEIQTGSFTVAFFLSQSLVFAASYFASTLGAYFFPGPTRKFLVWAAGAPYFLGWCCLIAAVYLRAVALDLAIAGGALIGFGSAGFYMAWQRLFASQKPAVGNRDLILACAFAPVIYFALYLIPAAVTAFLIPSVFMPLFALSILVASRTTDLDQPMFEDLPREHPTIYLQAIKDYWRSAFCIGAFALSCGVVRAIAVETPKIGETVNLLSMASMDAGIGFAATWHKKSLKINVSSAFRVLFPFVITAFLLLPFFGSSYVAPFAGALYALYDCALILMMIQCAQASRERGINPVFIYGFFGGIVYMLHDAGYLIGIFAGTIAPSGLAPLTSIALFSVYLLALVYFIGQGGFKQALSPNRARAERIELIPSAATPAKRRRPSAGMAHGVARKRPEIYDRISKQCALVKHHYGLSDREAEIMEYLARGTTVARIAELLAISENTVRTHSKRIYAKLDVHRKQELADLVDSFDPRGLKQP